MRGRITSLMYGQGFTFFVRGFGLAITFGIVVLIAGYGSIYCGLMSTIKVILLVLGDQDINALVGYGVQLIAY